MVVFIFSKFKDRITDMATSKYATLLLAFVTFCDSILFPITPIVLLLPMCLACKRRWFFYAMVVAVSSFLGSLVTYTLAYHFFDPYILKVITALELEDEVNIVSSYLAGTWGYLTPLVGSFIPINYNLITSMCGMMAASAEQVTGSSGSLGIMPFMIFCILGRISRFIVECYIIVKIGGGTFTLLRFLKSKIIKHNSSIPK